MRNSRPCFHVDDQIEYSRLQGHALYLMRPARRNVLWPVKTDWNNHRRSVSLRTQLICLSRALKDKRPQYNERHDKVISQHDNARPHVAKVVKTYFEMGSLTSPAVFFRRCSFWLSLVSINGTRPGWPALPVLWRSKKLDRFVDRLKRWPVF